MTDQRCQAVPKSTLLGYEFTIKMGRRRVEVYAYDYTPPGRGPEVVEVIDDDVWLAPRLAPPRNRPQRLAKKIAKRGGELHFNDGRALTEQELDWLHDDGDMQDALIEAAAAVHEDRHGR